MADKPPKKSKRVSMKGMGADAFFGLPAEEKEEPVSQDESMQVDQQAGKTEHHITILPADQLASTPVQQQASVPFLQDTTMPVKQSTELPVEQLPSEKVQQGTDVPSSHLASIPVTEVVTPQLGQSTGIPAKQEASKSAHQHTGTLMKATYYIYPDQDKKLERIRYNRLMRDEKVDKSELIREAIDKLVE